MQKFKRKLLWLLGISTFGCGLMLFFPLWILQSRIADIVQKETQFQIASREMSLGTGLGLGIMRGSVLALKAKDLMLRSPQGKSLVCREFIVAPQIVYLLATKLKATIYCELSAESEIFLEATITPFWAQRDLVLEGDLEKVSVGTVSDFMNFGGYLGELSGHFRVNMDLQKPHVAPAVTWDIKGSDMQVPSINVLMIALPSMRLGNLNSQGEFSPNKLKLKPLQFGSLDNPIEGKIDADFGLDPNGTPVSGTLAGTVRMDPDFEATQLKSVNWSLLFGNPTPKGERTFKKQINGSIMSLLIPSAQ